MSNTAEILIPNGNVEKSLAVSERLTAVESAVLSIRDSINVQAHAFKGFTTAVTLSIDESRIDRARFQETMENFSKIVSNTIEVKSGIVPVEFMRIKSYEDITAANSATINALFKQQHEGAAKLHTRTLIAMGSVNGLLVLVIAALVLGKDTAMNLIPKIMGLVF